MALVKLRPRKLKTAQPKDQTVGGGSAPASPPSRPPGVHFTTEMIFAEMAKLKTTTPVKSLPRPCQAESLPVPLATDVKAHKTLKVKPQVEEPAMPKNKKRRAAKRELVDLDRPGYLRLVDVLSVFPVSRAKWYAGVASGIYPPSHELGLRARGWRTADIKALVDAAPVNASVSI